MDRTLDPFCDHEFWACTGDFGNGAYHRCKECDYNWHTTSDFTQDGQIGICSICGVGPGEPYVPIKKDERVSYAMKDEGDRETYASGMVREPQGERPRFELLLPLGVPYEDQFLTRCARLLARGAVKYNDRNWERASGAEELARFQSSALRHLMQWLNGEEDEDHAAAVVFNLLAHETTKWKMSQE